MSAVSGEAVGDSGRNTLGKEKYVSGNTNTEFAVFPRSQLRRNFFWPMGV
jgi:hypothetical protein